MSRAASRPGVDQWIAEVAPIGLLIALLVALDQLFQTVVAGAPFRAGTAEWRFQLAIQATSRLGSFALAGLVAVGSAELAGNTRLRRVGVWLLGLMAFVAVASLTSLWFDGTTVRQAISAEQLRPFVARWARSTIVGAFALALALVFAIGWYSRSRRATPLSAAP